MGEDGVLFGVFAFVGGGRGAVSLAAPPPRPSSLFSGARVVASASARGGGGVHPKRAPWKRVANLAGPPPPVGCTKEAAEASTASRHPFAPADNRRPQPPPHCPAPAFLAAATSLFTPGRGSGVATSHVSRGPGCPAWGGTAAAELGSRG